MAACIYISATLFLTCIFIHHHWLTGTLTQTLTANVRKISMGWAGLDSTHLLRCETSLKTRKLNLWCAQYICKNLLLDIVEIKMNNYCWKEQCYNYLLHFFSARRWWVWMCKCSSQSLTGCEESCLASRQGGQSKIV